MRQRRKFSVATRHTAMLVTGALFVASAIVSALRHEWANVAIALVIAPLALGPWIVERWIRLKVPLNLQIQYGLLIVFGPYFGGYLGLYEAWSPWDTWVHLYSGIFISLALILALGKTVDAYQLVLPVWLEMVLVITVKAFIALLWEIAEFCFDLVFGANTQHDNFDTMTDMIAGLGPSLVVAAVLYVHRTHRRSRYIASLLDAGKTRQL